MLNPYFTETDSIVICGWFLANIFYVLSALELYKFENSHTIFSSLWFRLGLVVLKNERISLIAAVLFSFSPANVFLSAQYVILFNLPPTILFLFTLSRYTESVFAYFIFKGLVNLWEHNFFSSTVWLALAGGVRSNSFLFAPVYAWKVAEYSWKIHQNSQTRKAVTTFIVAGIFGLFQIIPYVAFQWWGYHLYCNRENSPEISPRPWCSQTIPHMYPFVQSFYWYPEKKKKKKFNGFYF